MWKPLLRNGVWSRTVWKDDLFRRFWHDPVAGPALRGGTSEGGREAAEREFAQAREIRRAAEVSLRQARTALISLEVEQENLTVKMIKETLPLFAERLRDALVIREHRWNDDVKRRRFATAGLVALGLVSGGYGVHVWQVWDATSGFEWCLWNQLQANGNAYCDLTSLKQSRQ